MFRGEFSISVAAVDDEAVIAFVLDQPVLDELAHQVCSNLAGFMVLPDLGKLLLELQDLDLLVLGINLLLLCRLLVGFDLGLCSSPFAADLQHVRGHALSH